MQVFFHLGVDFKLLGVVCILQHSQKNEKRPTFFQ